MRTSRGRFWRRGVLARAARLALMAGGAGIFGADRIGWAASGTWNGSNGSGDSYEIGDNWDYGGTFSNPAVGDSLSINSGLSTFTDANGTGDLLLSSASGDGISVTVNGGELNTILTGGGSESGIALDNQGTLAVTGGTVNTAGELVVGLDAGNSAAASFSGTAAVTVDTAENPGTDPTIYVGYDGIGNVTESQNANVAGQNLVLGAMSGSSGIYNLDGGSLALRGTVAVGGSVSASGGTGSLNVSGGSLSTSGLIVWGRRKAG